MILNILKVQVLWTLAHIGDMRKCVVGSCAIKLAANFSSCRKIKNSQKSKILFIKDQDDKWEK